ncbi:MAG TPA: AAA family ATPase [Candidatus Aveggerthella stercoripullorum]|uniref:AAA family ATPase n=1 Tax=Candidatus Aveggerthella stercoripullorum TaxID=2840688 RepID=A0A9D1D3Y1_9ACTN|nr:AAA family ATPase [Candidatus Aveggerthella stercoripullorum]
MKQSNIYRLKFQGAVDRCIASLGSSKRRKLATGFDALDSITGGFAAGDVSAIIGESGTGKSCVLRCLSLAASANNHVLYVPLQEGTAENAARKLIALEAGLKPSSLEGQVESSDRILALEAGDRLKEADLGIYAADEMMFTMLLEAATEDFTGYTDVDQIEGAGFVLIDSLSMLDDGDVKSLIRALKGLAYGSDLAVIVSVTGGTEVVKEVADASCVVQLSAEDSDSTGAQLIQAAVLKDNWGPNAGCKSELLLDKATLAVGAPQE